MVTSHHFVEPLVLSVLDFSEARVDVPSPVFCSHLGIMILVVNADCPGQGFVKS